MKKQGLPYRPGLTLLWTVLPELCGIVAALILLLAAACSTDAPSIVPPPPCGCALLHTCSNCEAGPTQPAICHAHTDCASAVCLLGSCVSSYDVAYVVSGQDGDCSRSRPCARVATALDTQRSILKLSGVLRESVTIGQARNVSIQADPGTMLLPDGSAGFAIWIGQSAIVSISDLTIGRSERVGDVGILVPVDTPAPLVQLDRITVIGSLGPAIRVGSGKVQLTHSSLTGNLGGGLTIDGDRTRFVVSGNVFLRNGTSSGTLGGIRIDTQADPDDQIEFNTFYTNTTRAGVGGGIHCSAGPTFVARNNLLSTNGSVEDDPQVSGNCAHAYTLVHTITTIAAPSGPGNLSVDPQFTDAPHNDFHVRPTSPAIGAAQPGATDVDHEGAARGDPATLGAFEIPGGAP